MAKKASKKLVKKGLDRIPDKEKIGTIHDAKNEILFFFREEDKERKKLAKEYNKKRGEHKKKKSIYEKAMRVSRKATELDEWDDKKKALIKFNKIVTKKKIELENEIRRGRNVRKNMNILQGKEKIELIIPKEIRQSLSDTFHVFKLKEFVLRPYSYDYANNKIKFLEGKDDFFFILDTGFKKHKITYKELKDYTVMSEKNLVASFINIYEKDVQSAYDKDKKSLSDYNFKKRKKIYDKLFDVIEHNRSIATMDSYRKKLAKVDKKGKYIRKGGEYPMMFAMYDELIQIYIP